MSPRNRLVEVGRRTPSAAASRRDHLQALKSFSQILAGSLDYEELLRAAQTETLRAVEAQAFLLALYDQATQTVEVVRQFYSGVELAGGIFPMGTGLTSQVIGSRNSQLIGHWSREGPPVQVQYASNTPGLPESGVIAPLLFGDQVLGVISAYSYRPEAFDADDLLALEVIASQVAIAIAHVRHSDSLDVQLRRRMSESDAILASMADALLVVDTGGRLVRLNSAARELLCFEDASIVLGQPLDHEQWGHWPLGAQEVAETLAPMVEVLRRGQVPPSVEVELKAQGRRFLSFSGTPMSDAYGALTGCLLVVRDVTAMHEVERLKREMLLIASHDLKTPVTVIKSQAQVLRRGIERGSTTSDKLDAGLRMIVSQSDRLTRLLNLLMDMSQIEAGRLEIQSHEMDLAALVATLIDDLHATSEQHRLTLRSARPVLGNWDEQRLHRVVGNLLTNAIKYSPSGGSIAVSIRQDKRYVTVRVRDQGVGLSPEDAPHVFERFYRAQATRQLEGTGLGLYICQNIVAAHGGRVWMESAGPGDGTTACFTLPRGGSPSTSDPARTAM